MPVSFTVTPRKADPIHVDYSSSFSTAQILAKATHSEYNDYSRAMIQCGFSAGAPDEEAEDESYVRNGYGKVPDILPDAKGNGFVNTIMEAYDNHRALVIRPDDVWLTILTQFNFFVNARAELLRANFVAHQGQRPLKVEIHMKTRDAADFGDMARQMVDLIDENVVDPTLRAWVLPSFTTTTQNDTTVAAVITMSTLKAYFTYDFAITGCGIPRVTLEGEKFDWVDLLQRIEKLKEYGIEAIAWYHLLRPVLSRFAAAFDDPSPLANAGFWQRVATLHTPNGSGNRAYHEGWINAFNAFSESGKWLGTALKLKAKSKIAPESLSAKTFWNTYSAEQPHADLVFDDTPFHRIHKGDVPPAYAKVDITLTEDLVVGQPPKVTDCFMMAGMMGMRVSSSGDFDLSLNGENDTVQPAAAWWMCAKGKK
ncbi:hypothetical protein FB45DRAFT_1029194 [Roridomyces roridus]|uniref:Uncharacterized protein n=1 Tax=Roridomyces roridus TaxID=1738132 RepID=A0AAD7FJ30_9AGAR|nr:hypothetical protein FB45DRAFT_1029194 [Roridomyces roridus]